MPRPDGTAPRRARTVGQPTLINNVETWANVPIIRNGGGLVCGHRHGEQGDQGLRAGG